MSTAEPKRSRMPSTAASSRSPAPRVPLARPGSDQITRRAPITPGPETTVATATGSSRSTDAAISPRNRSCAACSALFASQFLRHHSMTGIPISSAALSHSWRGDEANASAPTSSSALANRWVQLLLGVIAMMAISSPQYTWTLFTGPLNTQLGTTLAELQWTF